MAATITLTPTSGPAGGSVRVVAQGFPKSHGITALLDGRGAASGTTNSLGAATLVVPIPVGEMAGAHDVAAATTYAKQRIEAHAAFTVTAPLQPLVPTTDLPGWRLVFSDDFLVPFSLPTARWHAYPLGYKDTSKQGSYDPSIVTVHDSLLDVAIHTVAGAHKVAAFWPILPSGAGQLYGRYAIRFRADSMPGYKAAWLLWPQSEVWPRDGEIDWPEASFDATVFGAHMHRENGASGADQDSFSVAASWQDWHTAVLEWTPTRCEFFLDGVSIGKATSRIPNTPMRWVIQNETNLSGVPADAVSGHVLIDWVAVWAPA